MNPPTLPNRQDVLTARERIRDRVHRTPVMTSTSMDALLGCKAFFKFEHLQRTGSFKFRGASHAVGLLEPDCPGVATHSSGNHGAALAAAAGARGIPAHVVMPTGAAAVKRAAVEHYGGIVHTCQPTQRAREEGLQELLDTGMEGIPPYDDERIIAGQGTVALELLEQVPDLEMILAPVGGGGLISGIALAVDGRIPVVGAEPSGADDTARSLAAGHRVEDHNPVTVADGLRALVGLRNLAIISRRVDGVVTTSEAAIGQAMEWLWTRTKQLVEPSGAVPVAAILEHPERFAGRKIGVVLSGGNMDFNPSLPERPRPEFSKPWQPIT